LSNIDGPGEGDDGDVVFRSQAVQKTESGGLRLLQGIPHAAAHVQRQHDGDTQAAIHPLAHGSDRHSGAIELDLELLSRQIGNRAAVLIQDRHYGLSCRRIVRTEAGHLHRERLFLRADRRSGDERRHHGAEKPQLAKPAWAYPHRRLPSL